MSDSDEALSVLESIETVYSNFQRIPAKLDDMTKISKNGLSLVNPKEFSS
jgi:hypothetical protein